MIEWSGLMCYRLQLMHCTICTWPWVILETGRHSALSCMLCVIQRKGTIFFFQLYRYAQRDHLFLIHRKTLYRLTSGLWITQMQRTWLQIGLRRPLSLKLGAVKFYRTEDTTTPKAWQIRVIAPWFRNDPWTGSFFLPLFFFRVWYSPLVKEMEGCF